MLWPSWIIASVLTLLFLGEVILPLWVQYLPFVLSFVFLGLPHGAIDHLVIPRLRGERFGLNHVGIFVVGYLLLVIAYLALWFVFPAVAFALFIGITWFHWGQGDLYVLLVVMRATHLSSFAQRLLALLIRGGLPMLIPLLAFPDTYRSVAHSLVQIFQPEAIEHLSWMFSPGFRWGAGLVFGAFIALYLSTGYIHLKLPHDHRAWQIDTAEIFLLLAYFWVVPPILAVGLYFCGWHAVRHIARLLLSDSVSTAILAAGQIKPALLRFIRDATPLTFGALLILAILFFLVPHSPEDLPGIIALYLALISALTLPHIVIVSWMDKLQAIWR